MTTMQAVILGAAAGIALVSELVSRVLRKG